MLLRFPAIPPTNLAGEGDFSPLAVGDVNGDGKPDAMRTLLPKVEHPHGLALHDGWLYVGELTGFPFPPGGARVWRVPPGGRCG